MPEVTLGPINQCTLDDPTDGTEPPSFIADAPRGANLTPPCDPPVAGAGGRGSDECTDALVRRFSGEGGAPATADPPSEHAASSSCLDEGLRALQTCSSLLLIGPDTPDVFTVTQGIGCAAAVGSLVECLATKDDSVR